MSIKCSYLILAVYVISRHKKKLVIDQIVKQLQKLNFITSSDDKNFDALVISKDSTIMKKDNVLVLLDGLNDFNNDIIIKIMENNVKQKIENMKQIFYKKKALENTQYIEKFFK